MMSVWAWSPTWNRIAIPRGPDRAGSLSGMFGRPVPSEYRTVTGVDGAENGDVLERDPGASLDLGNNQMGQVSVRAAEVEMEFHPDHGSPFLGGGTDLELQRPPVSGLLVELPVRVRHRVGPYQPAGSEPCEGGVPLALPDPLANPGGVHPGIDDEVRDVDVPRSELPSGALSERPQAELRAGEGRVSDAAAQARGCAGEEDASAPAR